MKKQTTKRALLLSAITLIVCISMLVGTTFAWFTDSVTSANNIIKSGNLDITMDWADGTKAVPADDSSDWKDASAGAIFNYSLWEPGYTEVRHIKIANAGSLALKYQFNIVANGTVSKLADVIDVYYVDPAVQVANRTDLTADKKIGTLTEVLGGISTTASGNLLSGEKHTVTLALKMQESAGNEYQNISIGTDFTVQLLATQLDFEEDSFGKDYDEKATYPAVANGNIGGTDTLTVNDVSVTLPTDAPEANYTLSVSNKNLSTNAAGETSVSFDIDLLKDNVKVEAESGKLYNVNIFVGKHLVLTGVTHKGSPIGSYDYDSDSGEVAFQTDSFSPFAVSYKADTFVANTAAQLQELIALVTDNDKNDDIPPVPTTIVLGADILVDSTTPFTYTSGNGAHFYVYRTDLTLDLNGHDVVVAEDALMDGKTYANAAFLIHYSDFKLVGEGNIVTKNQSIGVYGFAHSNVEIYGGNFDCNAYLRNESAVYVNNPNVFIDVYGGTYLDSKYAFNVHDTKCAGVAVITLHEGVVYETFLKNGKTDVVASDINGGRIAIADGCELEAYTENGANLNRVVKP